LEDRQELIDDLLAVLHERPSGEQRVLAWVEQFKASALADLLARHPPDSGTDKELACLLMERERLRDKLDWQMPSLLVEIDVPASQRGPTLAACDARRAKSLSAIRLQLQHLEEQILRRRDGACEWREGTVIDPTRVHQLLDEQTTLISYYSAKGQLFALTATRTEGDLQIHPLRISLAEVERQWWQARRLVTRRTSQTADVQSRMAYFWETLIAPLEQRLCNRARLLILPHRGLFHIPYAGLYDAERGQYLIERWAVQLAPSATILDRCRRRTPGTQKPLLVGFPGHRGQADYLPGVEKEVRTLSSLVSASDVLVGEHATAHNVMTAASGRSLVHLAGHAFYNNVNPLESGMPLAGGRWLRAADLYLQHGHLAGSTVVLSGCSTGRGRPTGGDILGLTSAFLYAGAVAIIASLWRVDDAATVELMTTFYRALKEGAETADALRKAQVELLQSKRHAPPYFWAPFGLSGDSQVTKFSEVSWPNNAFVL
jgi:CHAT domain-containing protein